jgi:hypothetical protein
VSLLLPRVEVWEDLQPEAENLTWKAGPPIIREVIEDELRRHAGPRHQPDRGKVACAGNSNGSTWYLVGQKAVVECLRARSRGRRKSSTDSYKRFASRWLAAARGTARNCRGANLV